MTVEDEILKELKFQTKFIRANTVLLTEIKFELQNARTLSEASYKIRVNKPGLWEQFRYWLKGKIGK